ncbi:MAG: site-specific integrase [Lentisphaerae bacterium]|nr:site-specific integrase [Lentisphaerota bacterium]
MSIKYTFPTLLESFFIDNLMQQRKLSPDTIASYRDTFKLLLKFAQKCLKKEPSKLMIEDLNPSFIISFLDHLEKERGNVARTRNNRLSTIHSFFKYVALEEPACGALAQRIRAIPSKRYKQKPVEFLTPAETDALLAAPNQTTWTGRRDKVLLLFALQTGLRVSELVGLCCKDIELGTGAHVRCIGKGRKERCTPLRKEVVITLRAWLRERNCDSSEPLFPNTRGTQLSRDGVEYLLAKHVITAAKQCPTLMKKRISPHVQRHTTAMDLLHHGVDRTVIALWLGHEQVETTQIYLHADMKLKEQALNKAAPKDAKLKRFQPDDKLLTFLKSL